MHNRKFNVQKDFEALNELENKIMPICEWIKDEKTREILTDYIRKTFWKQFIN